MSQHGKKIYSPGWEQGNHWGECQRCSLIFRTSDLRKEWTGLKVCNECWEPRHPQDFVKSISEDTSARGIVSPETQDTYKSLSYNIAINPARAGIARAGDSRSGFVVPDNTLPVSSFS